MTTSHDGARSREVSHLRSSFSFLYPYLLAERRLWPAAALPIVAAPLLTLALPLLVRFLIDDGFSLAGSEGGHLVFLFPAGIGVALGLTSALRLTAVNRLADSVCASLSYDLHGRLLFLGPACLREMGEGRLLSHFASDMSVIGEFLHRVAPLAARNVLICLGAVVLMISASPTLSLLTLATIAGIGGLLGLMGRLTANLSRSAQRSHGETTARALASLRAAATVQASGAEACERRRFRSAYEETLGLRKAALARRAGLTALTIAVVFAALGGLLQQGSVLTATTSMTPGMLGQFILAAGLAAALTNSLSESWGDATLTATALARLKEAMAAQSHETRAVAQRRGDFVEAPRGELILNGVSFSHRNGGDAETAPSFALRDLSLHVAAGERIALVGPSGAGKSTLFQLLQGFHEPESGEIRLDGASQRDVDPRLWRRRLAVAPQDPHIFDAGLRENLRYAAPNVDRRRYRRLLDTPPIDAFVASLPDGDETRLGRGGVALSGGQRQIVVMARAMLRDAPLMLLDEAANALDAKTEDALLNAVLNDGKERTVIAIAHRFAAVRRFDRIVVVENGRIRAIGTHRRLMEDNDLYRRLARLQGIAA